MYSRDIAAIAPASARVARRTAGAAIMDGHFATCGWSGARGQGARALGALKKTKADDSVVVGSSGAPRSATRSISAS
jgi:hypothetical protein